MNLLRRTDPTVANAEDLLRLWAAILAAAFLAVVWLAAGWAFDSVTGLIGELRRGRR